MHFCKSSFTMREASKLVRLVHFPPFPTDAMGQTDARTRFEVRFVEPLKSGTKEDCIPAMLLGLVLFKGPHIS